MKCRGNIFHTWCTVPSISTGTMKSALLIGWKEGLGIKNFTQTSVTTRFFFFFLIFNEAENPRSWMSTEERNTTTFSAISCFILKNKKSGRKRRRRRRRKQWKDERIRGRIWAVFSERETDDCDAESCFSEPCKYSQPYFHQFRKNNNDNIQASVVKLCLENLNSNMINLTGVSRWEETGLKGGIWLEVM